MVIRRFRVSRDSEKHGVRKARGGKAYGDSCKVGSPTSHPKPGGPPRMPRSKREPGFTLIELLIVVAIIGIIAAIAIPNLLNAIDRSKQKRTMADMRSVGTACEEY